MASPDSKRRSFQPRGHSRRDRNPAQRSVNGPAIRGIVDTAHGVLYQRVAGSVFVIPGRQGKGLDKDSFEGPGKIDGNPFHTSIVGGFPVSTKTVIRLDR